jgi:hypothetical protein
MAFSLENFDKEHGTVNNVVQPTTAGYVAPPPEPDPFLFTSSDIIIGLLVVLIVVVVIGIYLNRKPRAKA